MELIGDIANKFERINHIQHELDSNDSDQSKDYLRQSLEKELEKVDQYVRIRMDELDVTKEQVNAVRQVPIQFDWDKASESAEPQEPIHISDSPPVPKSAKEAVNGRYGKYFLRAMMVEMESIMNREVYTKAPLPKGRRAIASKWVFDYKIDPEGWIKRFKARLVAMGNSQVKDIDYCDTHSPVVKAKVVRILLALSAVFGLRIEQIDIKTAFLYGDLKEPNWMKLPAGFQENGPDGQPLYARLDKALYGLHQAGREWWKKLNEFFLSRGFSAMKSDSCTYLKIDEKTRKLIIVLIYVDDILIACTDSTVIKEVKDQIKAVFEISDLGEAKWILKIQIKPTQGGIWIGQTNYIRSLLEEEGIWDKDACKWQDSPMIVSWSNDLLSTKLDQYAAKRYATVLAKLLYLAMQTRPDILYAVNVLAQYQRSPTRKHMQALIRILYYLRKTYDHGLYFRAGDQSLTIFESHEEGLSQTRRPIELPEGMREHVYADASYGGEEEMKSRSGYVFFACGCPVVWFSKKQTTTALSSTEAEVNALVEGIKEAIWFRDFMSELGFGFNTPTMVSQDNQSVIAIAANPVHHARIKHMEIKTHFIREKINDGTVKLVYCPTELMIADILTKPLPPKQHMELVLRMGVRSYSELSRGDDVNKEIGLFVKE